MVSVGIFSDYLYYKEIVVGNVYILRLYIANAAIKSMRTSPQFLILNKKFI